MRVISHQFITPAYRDRLLTRMGGFALAVGELRTLLDLGFDGPGALEALNARTRELGAEVMQMSAAPKAAEEVAG